MNICRFYRYTKHKSIFSAGAGLLKKVSTKDTAHLEYLHTATKTDTD